MTMRIFTLLLLSSLYIQLSAYTLSGNVSSMSITVDAVESISCFGEADGAIAISVEGGALPLTYQWSNHETLEDLTDLSSGTYKVTVSDADGVSAISPDIVIEQPELISVALNFVQSVTCADADNGAIEITVYGGTEPYEFMWSDSSTLEDPVNLPMDDYQFTITDAKGCTWDSPTITVNEPNAIVLYETITSATPNESDGMIEIDLNGGLPPYQFYWDNGSISANLQNVPSGTYCVSVTDAYDCTVTQCYEISEALNVANETIEGLNSLDIFPNPATEYSILNLDLDTPKAVQLQIIDITGRELLHENIGQITETAFYINTSEYAKGIYFAKIIIEEKIITKKMMVR